MNQEFVPMLVRRQMMMLMNLVQQVLGGGRRRGVGGFGRRASPSCDTKTVTAYVQLALRYFGQLRAVAIPIHATLTLKLNNWSLACIACAAALILLQTPLPRE
eukprot:4355810-Pleurochrysis_carterae.AAC.2